MGCRSCPSRTCIWLSSPGVKPSRSCAASAWMGIGAGLSCGGAPPMTTTLLDILDLHVEIGKTMIGRNRSLRGVDLSVAPGRVRGLVGESGARQDHGGAGRVGSHADGGADHRRVDPVRRDGSGGPVRAATCRAMLGRDLALIPQDPMTALNPVRPDRHGRSPMCCGGGSRHGPGGGRMPALWNLLEEVHIREPRTGPGGSFRTNCPAACASAC